MIKPYPYGLYNRLNQFVSFQPKMHVKFYYIQENVSILDFSNWQQSIQRSHTNIEQKNKMLLFFYWFFCTIHFLLKCYQVLRCSFCIFINVKYIYKSYSTSQIRSHMYFFILLLSNSIYCLLYHKGCTQCLATIKFKDHQVLK